MRGSGAGGGGGGGGREAGVPDLNQAGPTGCWLRVACGRVGGAGPICFREASTDCIRDEREHAEMPGAAWQGSVMSKRGETQGAAAHKQQAYHVQVVACGL